MDKQTNNRGEQNLIVVLGPTASGKTTFAAHLALRLQGEIISADSRQVYRGMDLGTGKDYDDYSIEQIQIPYHLIDIVDPNQPYNVYQFQKDFLNAYADITNRQRQAIICGGTGLYLEAVMKGYRMTEVPPDESFRASISGKTDEELIQDLKTIQPLHNTSDTDNRKRLVRALEIAIYYQTHPAGDEFPDISYGVIGIRYDRQTERGRITNRLHQRLKEGMVDEVDSLQQRYGAAAMEYFGLEYKWISWYLQNKVSYDEMVSKLNTAIHQFAKRQMTWFRRMQRMGTEIFWIDGFTPLEEKIDQALTYLSRPVHGEE